MPLVDSIRAEFAGQSAYSEPVQASIRAEFDAPGPQRCERCAEVGMAYPLTTALLALPLAPLPEPIPAYSWLVLAVLALGLGLHRLDLPWTWLLFVPAMQAARTNNPSLVLVGVLLVGIWAYREQRWWLLAWCVALTIGAKPQATLLLSGALAVQMIRAGHWRQLAISCGAVAALTLAINPAWPLQWVEVVFLYKITVSETAYWLWYMIPVAGWLLWRGQTWPGLALLQVCLFPLNIQSPYVALPLLAGYAHMPTWTHSLAWRFSWLFLPIAWLIGYEIVFVVCLLLPMAGAALWKAERSMELCAASGSASSSVG